MSKSSLAFLLFVLLGSTACKKENSHPQWDLDVLGPVFKASIGLENLLADSLQDINGDGAVSLYYESNLYDLKLDSVYQIPDTTIPTILTWPLFPSVIQPNSPFYSNNNNVVLSISGVQLKLVTIRSGFIQLELRNKLPSKVIYTYTIPGALKNNTPFTIVQEVNAAGPGGPGTFTGTYDFSGYAVDLTGAGGNLFNTISYNVQALSDPNGTPFTVNLNDTIINLRSSLIDIQPYYAKGYLGQSDISEQGVENIGIGGLIKSGMILLDSIRMDMNLENSIGADARFLFSGLTSVNNRTGTQIALQAPTLINRTININRAVESGNSADPVLSTQYPVAVTSSNSNLNAFLENLPDKINYAVSIAFNPLGNISSFNDFIYSDYLVRANLKIEMPLRFAAQQLVLADTQALNIEGITALDPVGESQLKLFADNGFPLDLDLQLFILDEQKQILDSLLSPGFINKGMLDANYRVTNTTRTILTIPLSHDRKQKLLAGKYLGVRARFDSPDFPQKVQLYQHNRLDLRLVADGIYSIR